jgi:hypothetical protein
MSEIIIKTNGTIENTSITVDGVDKTVEGCVVAVDMYARAPMKGSVSGDTYPGFVDVSYSCIDKGVITRTTLTTSATEYTNGVGSSRVETDDKLSKISSSDQIIQYIGKKIDQEKSILIDKIIDHCKTNNIPCPEKDILSVRTKESLIDRATDLSIKLEG